MTGHYNHGCYEDEAAAAPVVSSDLGKSAISLRYGPALTSGCRPSHGVMGVHYQSLKVWRGLESALPTGSPVGDTPACLCVPDLQVASPSALVRLLFRYFPCFPSTTHFQIFMIPPHPTHR